MRLRNVKTTPPTSTKRKGDIITAQIIDGILVLNCYRDKQLLGRYCIHDKEYGCLSDDKWCRKKLQTLYGYELWSGYTFREKTKFSTPEDTKIAEEYLSEIGNPLQGIAWREEEQLRDKRNSAYERKVKRIDELMDKVPSLPADFEEWCNEKIFENKEYLFYHKDKGKYWCSACGKWHDLKTKLKHNSDWKCKRTGKEVIVKKRQQKVTEKIYCMVLQQVDKEWSVARHFKVIKNSGIESNELEVYEEIRIMLSKIGKQVKIYYGQYYDTDEYAQEWWDTNPINRHAYAMNCYPKGIEEALQDTVYKNLGIDVMAARGWKLNYNKIMACYLYTECYEYLAKLGMEKLAKDLIVCMSNWGGVYGFPLNNHGSTASEVLKVNMQRIHRLRQVNGGMKYLQWLQYEENYSWKISEECMQYFENEKIKPDEVKFIIDRMSPVQIANYLKRQQTYSKKSAADLLELWNDYLSMAKRLGMDVNDEIVYRAKNLELRHDELVNAIHEQEDDSLEKDMLKKYPNVNDICKRIKNLYTYNNDEFTMIVPNGIKEIIQEGRSLHHCGGGSERYYERIESEETYICFLREKCNPSKSFYTVEIEADGTVRQKRSEYNRQPDIKEVETFLREWQKAIKKRLTEKEKQLAKESKGKRATEMKELRQKNPTFAKVLDDDLMEMDVSIMELAAV